MLYLICFQTNSIFYQSVIGAELSLRTPKKAEYQRKSPPHTLNILIFIKKASKDKYVDGKNSKPDHFE